MREVKLLSNGNYHVMLTRSGGGYSHSSGIAITRWYEDTTCDNWGAFCYVRDRASNNVWSTTLQPTRSRAEIFEAEFSTGRATFTRRDHEIETQTAIAVSSEDDIELRRVRICNRSAAARLIDVTSAAEVVLRAQATDSAHPAFNKLFVETQIDRELGACVALAGKYRKPHSADRVLEGAAMYQQATLKRFGATEADELLYERLVASIIYASAALSADPKVIAENQRGQSGLWGFGIFGNSPIVLLEIADAARMESVRQLVHAHDYWRAYGLVVDLVILCGDGGEPSFFELVGTLDGNELCSPEFSLVDDGRRHAVILHVERAPRPPKTGDVKCNSA